MSVPQSATSEVPSRTLTNLSAEDEAVPGEDTSEVRIRVALHKRWLNVCAGHEAVLGAAVGLEARSCISRGLCHRHRKDQPCARQGVREGAEGMQL